MDICRVYINNKDIVDNFYNLETVFELIFVCVMYFFVKKGKIREKTFIFICLFLFFISFVTFHVQKNLFACVLGF